MKLLKKKATSGKASCGRNVAARREMDACIGKGKIAAKTGLSARRIGMTQKQAKTI